MASPKKSRFGAQSIFVVFVLGFVAWAYFSQYKGKREDVAKKEKSAQLMPFSNSEVDYLKVRLRPGGVEAKNSDDTAVEIKKVNGKWSLLSPLVDEADPNTIESVLNAVSSEKTRESIKVGGDLAIYGLPTTPTADIEIRAGERNRIVEIGNVKAFDGSLYVRLDLLPSIFTSGSSLGQAVTKGLGEFRQKRVFTSDALAELKDKATRIQIANGPEKTTLEKVNGEWSYLPKETWPVDAETVKVFLSESIELRASDLWPGSAKDQKIRAKYGLTAPKRSLEITSDTQRARIEFGEPVKGQTYISATGGNRDIIYAFDPHRVEGIFLNQLRFLDKTKVFKFEPESVHKIEFKTSGLDFELPGSLQKKSSSIPAVEPNATSSGKPIPNAEWELIAGTPTVLKKVVSQSELSLLLKGISNFKAVKIMTLKEGQVEIGKAKTDRMIEVRLKDASDKITTHLKFVWNGKKPKKEAVEVASHPDSVVYVTSETAKDKVFVIAEAELLTLNWNKILTESQAKK